MLLSRSRFFVLLFLVLVGPFFLPKVIWFAGSRTVVGWVYYTSGVLDGLGGTKKSLVIHFRSGKDTIEFRGNLYFRLRDNSPVRVRYWRFDATDARIDLPVCIWGDTLVNSLLPFGIWLVLLLTPDRFDPLIPWGCRIWLRWGWPPVRVIYQAKVPYPYRSTPKGGWNGDLQK